MDLLPGDKQVVDLISKLKYSSGAYPKEMLSSRRQQFINQIANAGLGIGISAGIKNAAKQGHTAGTSTATIASKILETVLVAAIVIEAGTAAYVYREKIADFFKGLTTKSDSSEIIQQPGTNNSASSEIVILPTLTPPPTSSTLLPTPLSPFVTPVSGTQLNNTGNNNSGSSANTEATAVPNDQNGNRYGQTPKPEQTKDSNGNK